MSNCRSTFEPASTAAELRGTHTCDREPGHSAPHHCGACDTEWMSAPGQRKNYVLNAKARA